MESGTTEPYPLPHLFNKSHLERILLKNVLWEWAPFNSFDYSFSKVLSNLQQQLLTNLQQHLELWQAKKKEVNCKLVQGSKRSTQGDGL